MIYRHLWRASPKPSPGVALGVRSTGATVIRGGVHHANEPRHFYELF